MTKTRLHFHWGDDGAWRRFHTAVSLHGHTRHSREGLDFLPGIAHRIPVLRHAVAWQERRYEARHGRRPDYARAYWTPPLHEREALRVERDQIASRLDMKGQVSLTDHDNIDAALSLQLFEDSADVPVSVEWSVPYGPTVFHVGVHNLPREEAPRWMERLAEATAAPDARLRRELLDALAALPGVLIVLNHPLWDFSRPLFDGAADGALGGQLRSFIGEHREWLHALEINGLRPWAENRDVLELAAAFDMCLISGGDRHGAEPNANLNLTCASAFDEFVGEIRRDRRSDILFMPQYRQPSRRRQMDAIWDAIREYPEHPGRVHWTDRFFYRTQGGESVPFSSAWGGGDGPALVASIMGLLRLANTEPVRSRLLAALGAGSEALP